MVGFLGWCVAAAVSAALVATQPGDAKVRAGRVAPRYNDSGLVGEIDAVEHRLEACRAARHGIERKYPAHAWVWSVLRVREGQLERRIDSLLGQARPFSMSGVPSPERGRSIVTDLDSAKRQLATHRAFLRKMEEQNDPERRQVMDYLRERVSELERELGRP